MYIHFRIQSIPFIFGKSPTCSGPDVLRWKFAVLHTQFISQVKWAAAPVGSPQKTAPIAAAHNRAQSSGDVPFFSLSYHSGYWFFFFSSLYFIVLFIYSTLSTFILILILFNKKSGMDWISLWGGREGEREGRRGSCVVLSVEFLWIECWMGLWPRPLHLLMNDAISYLCNFERHLVPLHPHSLITRRLGVVINRP